MHDRDAANLEELVRPHHDALHDFLRRLTDDEETATSMLKETMYRALADADSVPRRPSAVRAWLVLIACAALRDGERLAPAGHDDRPVTLMSARMIEPLAPAPATQVERAINNLSPAHRELILDVAYRGKGLEQIAAIREESVPAVKSDLHAAMRFLRKNLENG